MDAGTKSNIVEKNDAPVLADIIRQHIPEDSFYCNDIRKFIMESAGLTYDNFSDHEKIVSWFKNWLDLANKFLPQCRECKRSKKQLNVHMDNDEFQKILKLKIQEWIDKECIRQEVNRADFLNYLKSNPEPVLNMLDKFLSD